MDFGSPLYISFSGVGDYWMIQDATEDMDDGVSCRVIWSCIIQDLMGISSAGVENNTGVFVLNSCKQYVSVVRKLVTA